MQKTGIEYLSHTWSPIAMRCSPVSSGCNNCWHLKRASMLAKNPKIPHFARQAYGGEVGPRLITSRLADPSKVKKPCVIGVQFMGDLFHRDVSEDLVHAIYNQIYDCKQHTFLILTKRPDRLFEFHSHSMFLSNDPIENLWLGVSVENQKTADERIPILLQIPAAVRFVSVEPMLGPVDIDKYPGLRCGGCGYTEMDDLINWDHSRCKAPTNRLDWVICGAETGPGARRMDLDWARDLYGQCRDIGVPFFMKQTSKKGPLPKYDLMVRVMPK